MLAHKPQYRIHFQILSYREIHNLGATLHYALIVVKCRFRSQYGDEYRLWLSGSHHKGFSPFSMCGVAT